MTRDELERFLELVGASTLGEYLGEPGPNEAMAVLEERIAWAVVHRNDPENGAAADFLARNVDGLKAVLDEGEAAWWARTETSSRVRKPDRGDDTAWRDMSTFATPSIPPDRADVTLDAPFDALTAPRKTLRKGSLERARGGGETLLPEAVDTPGAPVRDAAPRDVTWVDEAHPVDPDETDPIGYPMFALSAAQRDRDARLAKAPASEPAREPATTYIPPRDIDEDEPTDPKPGRAVSLPPMAPIAAPPSEDRASWTSFVVLALGMLTLLMGVVAVLLVVADIGRRRGAQMAVEAWEEAKVTSSTSLEAPPAPGAEPAVEPALPSVAPMPPSIDEPVRNGSPAVAPEAVTGPPDPGPPPPEPLPVSLARTRWTGTGGQGPLTLQIDTHENGRVTGRILQTVGGLTQVTAVTGRWDPETGALMLTGDGVALTGTLKEGAARGTWAVDGATKQWVLARQ